MVKPEQPAQPGRNDPCPCGSGKKYKKCCLKTKEFLGCKVDLTTMLKLLYCLIKGLKATADKTGGPGAMERSILITKRTLEALPADWMEKLSIQPVMLADAECYKVSIKLGKQPLIATPDRTIKLPGQN